MHALEETMFQANRKVVASSVQGPASNSLPLRTALLQHGRFSSAVDGTAIACVYPVMLHHHERPTGRAL